MTETTARLKCFEANHDGRDYAVGDVHGCFDLLKSALAHINFDSTVDRLFSVGDLIDRGPNSEKVCEWLNQPWFHAVRGNHEVMLLDSIRFEEGKPIPGPEVGLWITNGGDWFFQLDPEQQAVIRQAVDQLPWAIEVALADGGTAALIHADVLGGSWSATRRVLQADGSAKRTQQKLMHLVWSRGRAAAAMRASSSPARAVDVKGIDLIAFGHTPMKRPLAVGNTRWLDTGAVFGGYLSVAELGGEGQVWSMHDRESPAMAGWDRP